VYPVRGLRSREVGWLTAVDRFSTAALAVRGGTDAGLLRAAIVPALALTFAQPFDDIPSQVGMEFFARMDEVIRSLSAIPKGDTLWQSLTMGSLVLHVLDWRFHYRIDPDTNRVIVLAAAKRETSDVA
jgi:hypothetical protein